MVNGREVFRGNGDFHDFNIVRGVQDTVPNFRGLDQTVSSFKSKGWTLVLVNKVDPASIAIDQLKSDSVIMDHVGDRSAFGNTNVTGDDPATEPRWDQVSVLHPRPANHPRGLVT